MWEVRPGPWWPYYQVGGSVWSLMGVKNVSIWHREGVPKSQNVSKMGRNSQMERTTSWDQAFCICKVPGIGPDPPTIQNKFEIKKIQIISINSYPLYILLYIPSKGPTALLREPQFYPTNPGSYGQSLTKSWRRPNGAQGVPYWSSLKSPDVYSYAYTYAHAYVYAYAYAYAYAYTYIAPRICRVELRSIYRAMGPFKGIENIKGITIYTDY